MTTPTNKTGHTRVVSRTDKNSGLTLVQNKVRRVSKAVERKVGGVSKAIENQTGKWPVNLFFWATAGTIVTSSWIQFSKKKQLSLLLGEWAAAILLLSVLKKFTKVPVRAKR